jgi:hypothetical protein
VYVNQICIFLLLFADDIVLFSRTPDGLQYMLDKLYQYSCKWGMKVNINKTKVCVFQRRCQTTDYVWKYSGEILEVVSQFCYLGINLAANGSTTTTIKSLSDQALAAYNSLLALFRRVSLDVKTKLTLFDSLVVPILLYGSEVWGVSATSEVDKLHIKFCKRILGVKRQTPNVAVLGELGRLPIAIKCKERVLKYWLKVLNNTESPVFNLYMHQYNETLADPSCKNWAKHVRCILDDLGCTDAWVQQSHMRYSFHELKTRLHDQYRQTWNAHIQESSKLDYYRRFKTNFGMEKYLASIQSTSLIKQVAKFRLSSHNLEIETGRYTNTPREHRICKLCHLNAVESEFHFISVCPLYYDLRQKLIPQPWPNLHQFGNILSSNSEKVIMNVAKFIKEAMQKRDLFIATVN